VASGPAVGEELLLSVFSLRRRAYNLLSGPSHSEADFKWIEDATKTLRAVLDSLSFKDDPEVVVKDEHSALLQSIEMLAFFAPPRSWLNLVVKNLPVPIDKHPCAVARSICRRLEDLGICFPQGSEYAPRSSSAKDLSDLVVEMARARVGVPFGPSLGREQASASVGVLVPEALDSDDKKETLKAFILRYPGRLPFAMLQQFGEQLVRKFEELIEQDPPQPWGVGLDSIYVLPDTCRGHKLDIRQVFTALSASSLLDLAFELGNTDILSMLEAWSAPELFYLGAADTGPITASEANFLAVFTVGRFLAAMAGDSHASTEAYPESWELLMKLISQPSTSHCLSLADLGRLLRELWMPSPVCRTSELTSVELGGSVCSEPSGFHQDMQLLKQSLALANDEAVRERGLREQQEQHIRQLYQELCTVQEDLRAAQASKVELERRLEHILSSQSDPRGVLLALDSHRRDDSALPAATTTATRPDLPGTSSSVMVGLGGGSDSEIAATSPSVTAETARPANRGAVRPQSTRLFQYGVRIDSGVAVDSTVTIAAGEPILVVPGEGEEFLTTDIVQYQLMQDSVPGSGDWISVDTDEGSGTRSFRLLASVGSTFISSRCVRGDSEGDSSPLTLVHVREPPSTPSLARLGHDELLPSWPNFAQTTDRFEVRRAHGASPDSEVLEWKPAGPGSETWNPLQGTFTLPQGTYRLVVRSRFKDTAVASQPSDPFEIVVTAPLPQPSIILSDGSSAPVNSDSPIILTLGESLKVVPGPGTASSKPYFGGGEVRVVVLEARAASGPADWTAVSASQFRLGSHSFFFRARDIESSACSADVGPFHVEVVAPSPCQPHLLLPNDAGVARSDSEIAIIAGEVLTVVPGSGSSLSRSIRTMVGFIRVVTIEYLVGAEPGSVHAPWVAISASNPTIRLDLGTTRMFIRSRDVRGASDPVGPFIFVVIEPPRAPVLTSLTPGLVRSAGMSVILRTERLLVVPSVHPGFVGGAGHGAGHGRSASAATAATAAAGVRMQYTTDRLGTAAPEWRDTDVVALPGQPSFVLPEGVHTVRVRSVFLSKASPPSESYRLTVKGTQAMPKEASEEDMGCIHHYHSVHSFRTMCSSKV